MKIGLDLRFLKSNTCYERFIYDFAKTLVNRDEKNNYSFYVSKKLDISAKNLRGIIYDTPLNNYFAQKKFWEFLEKTEKNDLMIFFGENIPSNYKGRYIFFLPSLEDMFYNYDKKLFKKYLYQKMLKSSLNFAEKIFVFDEDTKDELNERFNISEERIEIIPPFFSFEEKKEDILSLDIKSKYWIKSDYLIYDGGAGSYKNIERIFEVFSTLVKEGKDISLVLFWDDVAKNLDLRHLVVYNNIQERVFFLGDLKDAEEKKFYTQSLGVLFPSLYEPFPFNLSKALFYDTPLLTSNIFSIQNIFQKKISYFNPLSRGDIQKSINDFVRKNHSIDYNEIKKQYTAENFTKNFLKFLNK
jgi:glycosyltransferase involved in cell wall biosynthesis